MGFRVAESSAVYGSTPTKPEVETIELFRGPAPGGADAAGSVRDAGLAGEPGSEPAPERPPADDDLHTTGPIPESLDELAQEITSLARRISRATHRMLELIAAFDRRGGWKPGGHRSCAHWLHVETGLSLGAAREKVRTARALTAMPQTSEAMKQGDLPYSKVRAMSRAADDVEDAQAEAELVARAKEQTTAQVEQMIRGFKHLGGRVEEAELERRRYAARYLSIRPDGNGMYQIRGTLPAEVGALLMRAVEAAGDALFREEWAGGSKEDGTGTAREKRSRHSHGKDAGVARKERSGGFMEAAAAGSRDQGSAGSRSNQPKLSPSQRRADAMGLLAERAMAAGFGGGGGTDGGESRFADGGNAGAGPDESSCACDAPPLSGTRAERYQVFLHVEPSTLQAQGEIGRSHLEDGTRVSAETSRRLSCDAGVVKVTTDEDGSVLDVGRRTRTIPPALRRALQVRDGGCRFPGCGLRFTEGHHLVHWADGGKTTLDNLVLLCRFHHRRVHEDGFGVRRGPDGGVRVFDPMGRAISPGERAIHSRTDGARSEGRAISSGEKAIDPDVPIAREGAAAC
jgi:hypothetical protein